MNLTVGKIIDDYMREHVYRVVVDKARRENARHAIATVRVIDNGCTIDFLDIPICRLSRDIVRQYVDARSSKMRMFRRSLVCISNSTIAYELRLIRTAIHHARKEGRISADQIPIIDLPKVVKKDKKWLTKQEVGELLIHANNRCRLFIHLALATASRKTAIENLKWNQIDFDAKLIYLAPEGHVQTKKYRPTVPITNRLESILRAEYERKKSDYVLGDNTPIRYIFEKACACAGMIDVNRHTLRHTAATWMAQDGVPMWKIAGLLGDSEETVRKNYAHHSPSYLRDASESLELDSMPVPDYSKQEYNMPSNIYT